MIGADSYRLGLVMGRAGLNDAQVAYLRVHVETVERALRAPVTIVAPVVPRKDVARLEGMVERTNALLEPLKRALPTARFLISLDVDLNQVVRAMAECDEVHCATCRSAGSEFYTRAAAVHRRAQSHPRARVFRWLHFWVELEPQHLPSMDVGRPRDRKTDTRRTR